MKNTHVLTQVLLLAAIVCVICLTRSALGQCPGCTPPPSGMVGWWPTSLDLIEPRSNGTLSGGAQVLQGIVGDGIVFPAGASGLFEIPHIPKLRTGTSFTVDVWMRLSPNGGVVEITKHVIVPPFDLTGFDLSCGSNGGQDRYLCWGVYSASGSDGLCHSNIGIPVDQWHLVAMTVEPTRIRIFIDGSIVHEQPNHTPGPYDFEGPIRVEGSNGRFDELEVFNRALSPAEILAIFQAGAAGKCKPPPVASLANTPTLFPIDSHVIADGSASTNQSEFYQWCLCPTEYFNGPCIPGTNCVSPADRYNPIRDYGVQSPGTYMLSLQVRNDCGISTFATKHIRVVDSNNVPTLSKWGLVALGVGLVVVGGVFIRSRVGIA